MRIKKLVLQTAYLQTLKEFYSSILELPTKFTEDGLEIQVGSSCLIFRDSGETEPFYHFAFSIPANKIEEAKNWLKSRVKLFWINESQSEIADFVSWNARSFYFSDPAGNILEFIARFDLKNETAESFSSRQIISVNEIGLVFKEKDLDERTNELLHNFQLQYFSNQPPLPQFRALGDDEGLFIVVPEHRNWYPTATASVMAPLTVEFESGSNSFTLNI
jgi:hypothetical protein